VKKLALKVCISGLLAAYLAWQVDWAPLWGALLRTNPLLYLVSTALTFGGSFILAGKYHLLIQGTNLAASLTRLFRVNLISRFYALFIPTGLGQDVVRWYKITEGKSGWEFFLGVTILERLTFMFTLLLVGLAPLFGSDAPALAPLQKALGPVMLAAVALGAAAVLLLVHRSLGRTALRHLRISTRQGQRWAAFLERFSLQKQPPWGRLFLLHGLWLVVFAGRMFILLLAAEVNLSFWDAAWMGSLVLLLQTLPISYAGLGVREGALAYIFGLYGLAAAQGVLVGALFFSQMLILAAAGYLLEMKSSS
jgi:hypothetical protein